MISVCNEPPRSTQPGHPLWVGTRCTSRSWDINGHNIQSISLTASAGVRLRATETQICATLWVHMTLFQPVTFNFTLTSKNNNVKLFE